MTSSSSANETRPLLPGYADSFPENRTTSHARRVAPLVCVIGAVFLERTTYYGVLANLVYYLMKMGFPAHHAVEIVLVFTGLAWFMSTIGGFIGDAFSGRYNAIWGSLLIYLLGGAVLVASAYFQGHSNFNGVAKGYCLFALLIISVGEGAYKANISAFGAEQVEGHTDSVYRNYFNWYYWSINLGCLFAYSGIAYLQMAVGYLPGFIVPLCCIFLATIVFCCGRKVYTVNSPTGYFRKVYQIVKEARSRRHDDERWWIYHRLLGHIAIVRALKGGLSMSTMWISKLGICRYFGRCPCRNQDLDRTSNHLSPFCRSCVTVSRTCCLSKFTPCRAL